MVAFVVAVVVAGVVAVSVEVAGGSSSGVVAAGQQMWRGQRNLQRLPMRRLCSKKQQSTFDCGGGMGG